MSNDSNVIAAAKRLREASISGQVCAPIRELIGSADLGKAYAVQEINSRLRVEEGARPVGSKIGLTSPAVQHQLGVNQPDFGLLWNDTEVVNGGEISVRKILQPRAEAEVAFVLAKDLTAKRLTSVDIISAIDYALASIEIVGSRIKDWDIQITDTIADNASASHWVVGHRPAKLSALDLINCKMRMTKNDEVVSQGYGKNCLGSPINATLWLARQMVSIGKPLRAGDLILSGALGPMVSVKAGDRFSATIEGLGEVSVRFGE
ncbi:2-keto-4-pentenoate hydratase [Lewinellaceae bacterium SD302]|nr:2-keto-4-pentenoate hydratase [Lewinellaceae bacterium SD302]